MLDPKMATVGRSKANPMWVSPVSTPRTSEAPPMTAAACLKCHATAYHDPAGGALESYAVDEGVGCEACHGAGSEYQPEAIMRDRRAALLAGLKEVSKTDCLRCHEDAHGKPFNYEEAVQKIAHPTKLPKKKTAFENRAAAYEWIGENPETILRWFGKYV